MSSVIYVAISSSTGQTIAQGSTASEAYNNAIAAGAPPGSFTVVPVGGTPRV